MAQFLPSCYNEPVMTAVSDIVAQFQKPVNFRDLGGYETTDGRHVREGVFFRSGGLYRLTAEELALLQKLHIRFIRDLRTAAESDRQPDPVIPGAEMLRHSGLEFANGAEIDFSPAGMAQIGDPGLRQIALLKVYYRHIAFGNEAFQILFENIVRDHVPLIFHCHSGKDRTGVAAMLILLALRVPRETVLADYLLSNVYVADDIRNELAANSDKIKAHPESEELIRMKTGVLESVGRLVLDEIFMRYPDPADFFAAEYGLDASALATLCDRYTV